MGYLQIFKLGRNIKWFPIIFYKINYHDHFMLLDNDTKLYSESEQSSVFCMLTQHSTCVFILWSLLYILSAWLQQLIVNVLIMNSTGCSMQVGGVLEIPINWGYSLFLHNKRVYLDELTNHYCVINLKCWTPLPL